jgi:hypothetical protein
MDGTLSRRGIAAFRLIPYITRNEATLPHATLDNVEIDREEDTA